MGDATDILDDLQARDLLHDHTDTDALRAVLDGGGVSLYLGVDPTAPSMHVGHLVGIVALRRFQDAGHRPIALVGGATGMVGDPSGRSEERNLLDAHTLAANVAGLRGQIEHLLSTEGPGAVRLVDNATWTVDLSLLEFLRDVGKHVTVNQMVAKDSVRSRMESEHGISYTEFSYMLLQAHDFWWLAEHHDCTLQIGGSDQWGNITAGIDLVRRRSGRTVHGLTWPLITRSDGAKMGKTADGAVWLDPTLTRPYDFHQYFLRVDDRDVDRFLRQLTLLPLDAIAEIMEAHEQAPAERAAQRALADAVTEMVHGAEEVRRATLAAATLFGDAEPTVEGLETVRGVVPEVELSESVVLGDLGELLVAADLASSKGDARRTLADDGFRANGRKLGGQGALEPTDLVGGRFVLLQRGKKKRHLVVVTDRA